MNEPEKYEKNKRYLLHIIAFSFIWSIAATVSEKYHDLLNAITRDVFKAILFPN